MINAPLHNTSFDQIIFTIKIDPSVLHDILSNAFGEGVRKCNELANRKKWGLNYVGTEIWVSRYRSKHGYCWLAVPATPEYLSILGQLAHTNGIYFNLKSVEVAFDFPFPSTAYENVEIMLLRLAHRINVHNGRKLHIIQKSGNFQQTKDGCINGKKTFYVHSINEKLQLKTGEKHPGDYIGKHTKIYAKQISGIWNIRIEMTMSRTTLKKYLPLIRGKYENTLKLCPLLKLSDFWGISQVDWEAFKKRALSLAIKKAEREGKKKLNIKINTWLNKGALLPLVKQKHQMKIIAKYIGSKRLCENLNQFITNLTWQEAFSLPLPQENIYEE